MSKNEELFQLPPGSYPEGSPSPTKLPTRFDYNSAQVFQPLGHAPSYLQPTGRNIRSGIYKERSVRIRTDQLETFYNFYLTSTHRLKQDMIKNDFRMIPDMKGRIQPVVVRDYQI